MIDVYDEMTIAAVDRFRSDQGWATVVPGFVDARTIERLWTSLDEIGQSEVLRARLLQIARVDR
jgi:hypothetical protein